MAGVIRKVLLAGVTRVATKAIRQVPVLGTAVVFGMAGYEMKKKGMLEGLANVTLDATPVVGVAKNAIDLVTGDWFPDRENPDRHKKEQRPRFSRHSGAEWAPFSRRVERTAWRRWPKRGDLAMRMKSSRI
ncbi:MAG: hypothetical protein ACKV2V_09785 [Blastocatellia bacterium]